MKITTLLTAFLIVSGLAAQNNLQDLKLYHDVYEPDSVVDPTYGIQMYDPLNVRLGGDSIRNCNGYACTGYVEDYYSNGQLLHKGYYVDGQLTNYKNYYPNGNKERYYRHIDLNKSKLSLYYSDGVLKSEIVYFDKNPVKWEDYYPSGKLEYEEVYDKSYEYYKKKNSYFKDGTPKSILELDNKKKLLYIKQEYFENGQVKMEGQIRYNQAIYDYQKIGKWKIYNKDGKLIKEQKWLDGKLEKEKTL